MEREDGRSIGLMEYEKAAPLENVSLVVPFENDAPPVKDANELCDFLPFRSFLAVSESAMAVLSTLRLDEAIEFSLIPVRNRELTQLDNYYVGFSRREWNVVDEKRAEIEYAPKTSVILWIERWSLISSLVPDLDLFLSEGDWIVTDRFKTAMELQGITGLVFNPIDP